jgi:5-methylcytosine-specific restriction endonuclease McrA
MGVGKEILHCMPSREEYLAHIEFQTTHRKKWLTKPVRDKRYIRGIISNKIKDSIRSRNTGQKTTDPHVRARVIAKTGGVCYLCFRTWNPRLADSLPHLYFAHMQIDHVIPFSKFGPNDVANYMPVCSRCNHIKSNLTLSEARNVLSKRG